MANIMSWKQLYKSEYAQLQEEGYDVSGNPRPAENAEYVAFGDQKEPDGENLSEDEWERVYHDLLKVKDKGVRSGYLYREPDSWEEIIAACPPPPNLAPLPKAEYAERISGAWFGRFAGCIQGKPVEMVVAGEIKKCLQNCGEWELDNYFPYVPEHLERLGKFQKSCREHITEAVCDDDIDYTILALMLYEKYGRDWSQVDLCEHWINHLPYGILYSCTKQAYLHYINRRHDQPAAGQIEKFATTCNPMREGINGVIRADFHGYINPADPRGAARMAYREAAVNCTKNGIYGMCFAAACISAALSKNPSLETILRSGLSVLPPESRLYESYEKVRLWHSEGNGWEYVNEKIYQTYGHHNWAGVMYNLPICFMALLEGNMDYTRTVSLATMAGMDTDCNAATVGSIIGAAVGLNALPKKFTEPFNDTVCARIAGFGKQSISGLAGRTADLHERLKS